MVDEPDNLRGTALVLLDLLDNVESTNTERGLLLRKGLDEVFPNPIILVACAPVLFSFSTMSALKFVTGCVCFVRGI